MSLLPTCPNSPKVLKEKKPNMPIEEMTTETEGGPETRLPVDEEASTEEE